jgi:hypothetical protein
MFLADLWREKIKNCLIKVNREGIYVCGKKNGNTLI